MIKPTHKAIREFQATRSSFRGHGVKHEMGLRSAFQYLLSGTARTAGWTLIPEETLPGKRVRPDGTFKDQYSIPRGWWESKDEQDDLEKEIQIKIGRGYPTANTIFEDSRRAILFQNQRKAGEFDLANASQLAALLTAFYSFTPPNIVGFEQAVEQFSKDIPLHAAGLLEKIEEGYHDNKKFRAAFDGFFTLCQQSLNPNIRVEAVKEMLVQHLLTERLIRTIFNNPEFTRRNVIAAEVEKVIDALVSPYFNREEFLATLDRFYKAIEEAAHTIESFSDKQHFLNSVYERFFQGYSVKVADTHGIVYTPQPIVDFMCASVEEVLKTEFGKDLGSPDVYIIDPCTGTGNFVVNLLNRVPAKDLERVYREQFFANEVMLMPYYIAALNIEHAYYERTGNYEPFEGLCFVDTLDLAEEDIRKQKAHADLFAPKNAERVERQRKTPITVVIGNPPYNMGQVNENDNNKNRKYEVIDRRVAETYVKDSSATLRNKLYDPYVKFFRWATDRLGDRDGIVCFVTNNSFVDQIAFDGMREHLADDFTTIYHADLHGNVRANPKLSGTTHNVFGIQVGVGITVAIQRKAAKKRHIRYHRVPEFWRREDKYRWLNEVESVEKVQWQTITPDAKHNWLTAENVEEYESFVAIGSKEAKAAKGASSGTVFKRHSLGVSTNRDSVVYGFDRKRLEDRVEEFCEQYDAEVDRYSRKGHGKSIDEFVDYSVVNWSSTLKGHLARGEHAPFDVSKVVRSLYRPYDKRYVYYDETLVDRPGHFREILPIGVAPCRNQLVCVSAMSTSKPFHCIITEVIPDLHLTGDTQCFPFYVYKEDGTGRRENVTDWAVEEFRKRYGAPPNPLLGIAPPNPPVNGGGSESESPHVYGGTEGGPFMEGRPSWSETTPETWDRAQRLRRAMTPAEKKLWKALRTKQLGLNFRRQHPVGPFIADFYSPEARLVVEVDGDSHAGPDQIEYDANRTRFMEAHGLRVKRYSNRQINENLEGVLQDIIDTIGSAPPNPHYGYAPPNPPVNGGELESESGLPPLAGGQRGAGLTEGGRPICKWDIFYYVYGILHHPGYREKFADNLKRELPRIPFAPDFWAFSEAGRKLAELHLKYEELKPIWEETPPNPHGRQAPPNPHSEDAPPNPHSEDAPPSPRSKDAPPNPPVNGGELESESGLPPLAGGQRGAGLTEGGRLVIDPKAKTRDLYHVEKMRLVKIPGESGDSPRRNPPSELRINDSITVTGIPTETFDYRLGNRSALEWVVDQYQIKTDKRSGITHDPNREDDPQYIVRLVGQVIRVSLETMKIIRGLPTEFC